MPMLQPPLRAIPVRQFRPRCLRWNAFTSSWQRYKASRRRVCRTWTPASWGSRSTIFGACCKKPRPIAGSRDHTPASPDVISPPSTRRSSSEGASAATPIETLYDTPVLPGDLVNGAVYVYAPFTCTARLLASPSRPSPPRRKAGPMPTVKLLWYAARARHPSRCMRPHLGSDL